MRKPLSLTVASLFFLALSIHSQTVLGQVTGQSKTIPAPAGVLGFTPGDDRKLASWAKVVEYFNKLAAASDRVEFAEIGKSTLGAPFVYATISAPENLRRLNQYKEIQRQLNDPRRINGNAAQLIARGKTVVA